ncbi:hypothetical protein OICFNHDK_2314 [Methylobacterium bullatum]|uniref:Uncharacterized protein n=1 Tax=Methylobacterium bullatum TaxID=570505 RepID=A0A679JZ55_9HYPH|nr:hypothetical protein OICFNHDK_2314 [Methylobacterium bullatum]CAA2144869.1 hypothetical protein MBLL_03990 [Methylobacterium bullatum]
MYEETAPSAERQAGRFHMGAGRCSGGQYILSKNMLTIYR